LKFGTSPRFKVSRGIKQGCPISPYLFLIASQISALHVSNSALEGKTLAERSIIVSWPMTPPSSWEKHPRFPLQ